MLVRCRRPLSTCRAFSTPTDPSVPSLARADDPADAQGAPISLQLIASRLMEERLLAMAELARGALGGPEE